MTLSIIVPSVRFPTRAQLYDIPSLAKNHVFALFGENDQRSLVNLNSSQPDGVIVGSAQFSKDGVKVTGNTSAVRFKGFSAPSGAGCTELVLYKTGSVVGNSGIVSLWSEASLGGDTLNRRILALNASGSNIYSSNPGATDAASNRPQAGNTEYLLSFTRAPQGGTSVLRRHNPDGSVAASSPVGAATTPALAYAPDAVFDIGMSPDASQVGVTVRSAGLWTGTMSEAEVAAAAAFMYQVAHG